MPIFLELFPTPEAESRTDEAIRFNLFLVKNPKKDFHCYLGFIAISNFLYFIKEMVNGYL